MTENPKEKKGVFAKIKENIDTQFEDMSEGDNHSLFIVQLENGSANVVRIFVD